MKLPLTNYNSVICCCSVAKWCPTLCDPMDCSTPGLPVLHYLPQFSQTRVHRVSDTIRPSHRLSSPSPPALNLSQLHGLFQWVSSSLWPDCHICTWLLTGKTISSVQFSHSVVSNSLQPHGLQHARLPCPSLIPGACSNSCSFEYTDRMNLRVLYHWWCGKKIHICFMGKRLLWVSGKY